MSIREDWCDYLRPNWQKRIALVVLLGFALLRVDSIQWPAPHEPPWKVYTTQVGEIAHFVLQDSSVVHLNTDSQMKVRFTHNGREVVLTHGEALFSVVHSASWPFSVRADGATIRTVGTAFSVRLRDDDQVDILVTDGRVAVDTGSGHAGVHIAYLEPLPSFTVIAAAGESIFLKSNAVSARLKLSRAAVKRKTAWTDGWVWFSKERLTDAICEFNRYHRKQLVLADPALANLEIGGRFRAADLDSFIATLEHSFDVQATSTPVQGNGAATIYLRRTCQGAQPQCNQPLVQ